jgi:1-acyl-sn-glycerol-3-phosphate acyltransferase
VAPHTSNWDLFVGKLLWGALGREACFLMKKDWFFFPLGIIFRWMGGIPVDRNKKTALTEQLSVLFKQRKQLNLAITPEGTRKANPNWKKGFYYIALKAEIPILLFGVDYEKKLIRCSKTVIPNGDIDAQIREIKLYFKDFKGKKPENFALGEV